MCTIIAAAYTSGRALSQAAPGERILHRDLPREVAPDRAPVIGMAAPNSNPAAIVAGDRTLPEPTTPPPAVVPHRETALRPDRNTAADGTLHYTATFNPDVLPFKRLSAFDTVREDYTMVVAQQALTDVPIGGTTSRARDRFWATVTVDLAPGRDAAIPSVAPDMRILSMETTPRAVLRVSKDGADNFFVRSDESNVRGRYALRFLVDADAGYFAPQLPAQRKYSVAGALAAVPLPLRPRLPARAQTQGLRTLAKLNITPRTDLATALNALIGYFRAFTATVRPPTGDDIYRDLCDSQAGVCRHRAFAFLVTAAALGLPTRFVGNEAHAFVEVWLPERSWQRIDLGGAALRLEVDNASDKTLHRPRSEDPFSKPATYRNNYTQLEGDIAGLSEQQLADKRRSLAEAPASGAVGRGPASATGESGDAATASGAPSQNPDTPADASAAPSVRNPTSPRAARDAATPPDAMLTPDQTLPRMAPVAQKRTPTLAVATRAGSVYRGAPLAVHGTLTNAGKPLANRLIELYLAPVGKNGKGAVLLGRAVTDERGAFAVDLPVPATAALAAYELIAASQADDMYNAVITH